MYGPYKINHIHTKPLLSKRFWFKTSKTIPDVKGLNETVQERYKDCLMIYFWLRSFHNLELTNWPNILVSKPNDFDNFCSCLAILFVQSLFSWCEWSSCGITYMNTKTYSMKNFIKTVCYEPFRRCHKPT